MVIGKILNNNVVVSTNDAGEEVIYMGRGIAFKKKIGDVIDDAFVEKEFVLKDSFTANQFQQLFADIPTEEVEAVKQVIDEAEQVLGVELSPNIYLTLTDHIHYALMRAREGIEIPNPLLFETRKFYPKEYAIAAKAVERFERTLVFRFPKRRKDLSPFTLSIVSKPMEQWRRRCKPLRSFVMC